MPGITQYIWLIWSLVLLAVWILIYFFLSGRLRRRDMLKVSLWTSLLGLTEPLFVPSYWSPPSLFDLARRTGFDIESLIFSFAIGGIAVVLYEIFFPVRYERIAEGEKHSKHHRIHFWAIISTPAILVLLLLFTRLNPIYSSFIAMIVGGILAIYCRLDLMKKMLASGIIFLGLYFVYFLTLLLMSPGYVQTVWNLRAISGILIFGVPLEELIFALTFGFFWSSIYEHWAWEKIKS